MAQRQLDGANSASTPDKGRSKAAAAAAGGAKGKAERAKKAQALASRVSGVWLGQKKRTKTSISSRERPLYIAGNASTFHEQYQQ